MAITITDTFDDGIIDTATWSAYRGPCAEEGGNAIIPGESGTGCRFATANNLNLTGDSVYCRVAALPVSTGPASSMVMGINAVDNANEYNSYLAIQVQGTTITYRYTTAFTNNDTTATFDPVNHKWWRIREAGGTTFWETAPDDGTGLAPGTFTARRSVANPMVVTAMRCELKCQDNSGGLHGQCFEVSHFRTSGQVPPAYQVARPGHHRLAIGNSSANLTTYASQYDSLIVQADKWSWRDQVKAINPGAKVLAYKDAAGVSNVSGTRRDGATTYMTGVSKTQADAGGSTWYLHSTAAGGTGSDPTSRIQFADYPGVYAANIALAAYQTAWINNVLSDLQNGNFDGLFIDDMNPSMGNHSGGGVGDVAEYPSDATYGAAFDSFVANVVPAIKAQGYLVYGNFGPFWGDRANQTRMNTWLSGYKTGAMDEFFVKWRDLTFHTPDQIVGQLENVRHALSRGRQVQLNFPGQAGQASTPGAKFAMACVWLVTRDQAQTTTFWDRTNGAYTDWDTFPEQDANLGAPVAPYRAASNGLFYRQFTNGEVWANVTGSTQTATFLRARPSDGATSASIAANDSVIFDYSVGRTIESWVLDGVPLTTGNFGLLELVADPPKERQDWVTAADSESAVLFRQPKHENRTITMKLRVTSQASMNAALDQVGALVDKLRKASGATGGVPLIWTPGNSSRAVTFTVLTGEITGLPISLDGDGYSWIMQRPIVTLELTCLPYWLGAEVLTGTATTSTPFQTLEIPSVTGDVPALGRLIVTDTASQSRRDVEWGLEGPLTYNSATSLLIDSDDMVTSSFSGAQATTTGAYDPNAAGNNSISLTLVAGLTTAVCGTGNLSHVGVFRVKARIKSGSVGNRFRLAWQAADGPVNYNAWITPLDTAGFQERDLGSITIPAVTLGTQRWTGRIEVAAAATAPGAAVIDYLTLVPQSDGYGRSRSQYAFAPGTVSGYDSFTGTTAGGALNTRTANLGGAWVTSGDATDFVFDDVSGEGITRSAISSSSGRTALLGSTTYTDMSVQVDSTMGDVSGTDQALSSLFARHTDTSNYVRGDINKRVSGGAGLSLIVVSGGVTVATNGTAATAFTLTSSVTYTLRLTVYSSGRAILSLYRTSDGTLISSTEVSNAALATGGGLASGKAGLFDFMSGAGVVTRHYDNFTASSVPVEQVAIYSGRSMQVTSSDTLRQDSTGTYYGRPPSYRGSRLLLPPGTSRVLTKTRRNDIETGLDDQVTDATQIQVGWTSRGLAVPR